MDCNKTKPIITRMRILFITIIFITQCSYLLRGDDLIGTAIVYPGIDQPKPGAEYCYYNVDVRLRNMSDNVIRIPTSNLNHYEAPGRKIHELKVFLISKATPREDYPIIYSLSSLSPVELRKGEVAEMQFNISRPVNWPNDFHVKFIYEIPKAIADRYGFWAGSITILTGVNEIEKTPLF